MVSPEEITKNVSEVIAEYVNASAINLNKPIDGRASIVQLLLMQLQLKKIMADILKFTDTPIIDETSKSMSITNTILLLAPILITVVISELASNRKTC